MAQRSSDPLPRLMARVEREGHGGCWIFTGPTKNGYSHVGVGRGFVYGHRLVYERLVAPIPDGRRIHHTCETPRCVNPDHLEPVTASEHAKEHGLGLATCATCGGSSWYVRSDGARRCRPCRQAARGPKVDGAPCPMCGSPKSPEKGSCSRSCGALLHNLLHPKPLPPHGTTSRYRRGCRCGECRAANSAYERSRRTTTH